MVNLHQLILQHFRMLFHEQLEHIFHVTKHRMLHDYLIILNKIHLFHLISSQIIRFIFILKNQYYREVLLEMHDNKQRHMLDVQF